MVQVEEDLEANGAAAFDVFDLKKEVGGFRVVQRENNVVICG